MLAGFAQIGTAQISDCMGRLYGVQGLRPLHAGAARIVGRAITVKTRPGDNLMIHKAISLAGPGDVIVVDGAGETANALVGELMMMDAQSRGVAAFVIDGRCATWMCSSKARSAVLPAPCRTRGPTRTAPARSTCR